MTILAEIIRNLSQPFDPGIVKQKTVPTKNGKFTADYIPWYRLCSFLDERAGLGNWEWSVDSITVTGTRLILVGKLTIYGDDRTLSMSATGTENLDCSDYGDPSSNAEAMALRRAVSKVSASVRAMWEKDGIRTSSNPKRHTQSSGNGSAIASLMQESDRLMQQLGWGPENGAAALGRIFPGKRSRRELTPGEFQKFNMILAREIAESAVGGLDR